MMIKRLNAERQVVVYCDLHGHSRKNNIFIYGCENKHDRSKRLQERVSIYDCSDLFCASINFSNIVAQKLLIKSETFSIEFFDVLFATSADQIRLLPMKYYIIK